MSEFLKIANQYGNVDIQLGVPKGYEHVHGERLQPLCRKLGIMYAQALIGWGGSRKYPKPVLDGVIISNRSSARLREAVAEREQRSALRRHRQQQKGKDAIAAELERKRIVFRGQFPNATDETIKTFVDMRHVYDSLEEVPLDMLTDNEIEDLRLTKMTESGVLLTDGGASVVPLFTASLPPDASSEITDKEAYDRGLEFGFTPQQALWVLNKLVKIAQNAPKREVYSLKDRLLNNWSEHLIDGRIARDESKACWSCGGSGIHWSGEECERCFGSGCYSSRTLYEVRYTFPGNERVFCYHTYSRPALLSDQPGADKSSYGHRLSAEDRKRLPFGFHDLMRIVRYAIITSDMAAKNREQQDMLDLWGRLRLPPLREDAEMPAIRRCLNLIERLTTGCVAD